MVYPNGIEMKMLAGGISEDDCKKCKVKNCPWTDEYGCAIAWYNLFRRIAEGTEQQVRADSQNKHRSSGGCRGSLAE